MVLDVDNLTKYIIKNLTKIKKIIFVKVKIFVVKIGKNIVYNCRPEEYTSVLSAMQQQQHRLNVLRHFQFTDGIQISQMTNPQCKSIQ